MAERRVVDLDKLATDLVAEGITAKLIDGRLVLLHGTYSELDYISLPWPESPWADDFWKAIRIMAAHADAGMREASAIVERLISDLSDPEIAPLIRHYCAAEIESLRSAIDRAEHRAVLRERA